MDNPIRIFLADPSRDYLALVREVLEGQPDLQVVGIAVTGPQVIERFPGAGADLLVTDLLMPGLDGVSLLRQLKGQGCLLHAIVVSAFYNEATARAISQLADCYLAKPCPNDSLIYHIRSAVQGQSAALQYDYAAMVTQMLLEFGVPPHLDGFSYLREAILRIQSDRSLLRGVTKSLYREIAKQFATTPLCVERSIRSAIDTGWDRRSPEQRRQHFGALFDSFHKGPSNVPFLTAMTEYLASRCQWDHRMYR